MAILTISVSGTKSIFHFIIRLASFTFLFIEIYEGEVTGKAPCRGLKQKYILCERLMKGHSKHFLVVNVSRCVSAVCF